MKKIMSLSVFSMLSMSVIAQTQTVKTYTIAFNPTSVKYQNPDPKSPLISLNEGIATVEGKKYKVYLNTKGPYTIKNTRTENMDIFMFNNASMVYIDYDGSGKLAANEMYNANHPIRLGDKMFRVKSIAPNGRNMVMEETDLPLSGLIEGYPAPDFSFTDLDGKQHSLKDYKGKFLLFNVWSVTCGSCIEFMPQILKYQKEIGEDKLQVVMLSTDQSYFPEDAEKRNIDTKKRIEMPWPNVLVPGGWNELVEKFKIQGYGDYLIDPNGKVVLTGPRQHEIEPIKAAVNRFNTNIQSK